MPSRIRGVARQRRFIRSMPGSVSAEIIAAFNRWGPELAGAMRARAPSRSGRLQGGIRHKVFPRTLRLQVGLLVPKRERNALFYAIILDLGRKARTVQARRRRQSGGVTTYAMNVAPISAMRFITGPMRNLRSGLNRHIHGIWDRALRRSSAGGSE